MRIFFSVGEPSGDQHAAHLISEIKRRQPDAQFIGLGGPLMKDAGCRIDYPLTDLAVMGILKVLPMLGKFVAVYRQAKRIMDADKPDAIMLVDFPGFNWWIAKAAKKRGIPVFFYLPPQLWAWGPWRVKRVKKLIDHVMSALQFETDWYREKGIDCHFVGHPFFDEIADHQLNTDFIQQWSTDNTDIRNVAILPGSRSGEVARNWPIQLKVMRQLHAQHPNVRFLVASYKQKQLDVCRAAMEESGFDLPVHFFTGRTSEIMEVAECINMVSGSVSLEVLARRKPAVVMYRIKWLERQMKHLLMTCDSITLPNLIAGRQVLPEFISGSDDEHVPEIVEQLSTWLSDESIRQEQIAQMDTLCVDVVKTGATVRAADYFLSEFATDHGKRRAA